MKTRTKPELRVEWRKRDPDGGRGNALYYFGNAPTGGLLAYVLERMRVHDGKTLAEELAERGYDLSTLRFSIRKRKESDR